NTNEEWSYAAGAARVRPLARDGVRATRLAECQCARTLHDAVVILKSDDRLKHRHPAIQTCGIRREGSAIRNLVNVHHFGGQPEPLGRNGMPFDAAGVLPRVSKLSEDHGAAAVHTHLPGS